MIVEPLERGLYVFIVNISAFIMNDVFIMDISEI